MMKNSIRQIHADVKFTLLLLLIGVFVKFWSITYGLPSVYNSTEYFLAKHALSLGARKSLEPLFFIYPTLYVYLLAALFGCYFTFGKIFGIFTSSSAFAFQFIADPSTFYLLGRSLSAAAIIVAAVIVYKIARFFLESRQSFYIGLLFLSSSNIHFFGKWMVPDALLILGTTAVIYFIIKMMRSEISGNELLLGAIITGLTISLKYNAGFLAFGWLTAIWLQKQEFSKQKRIVSFFKHGLLILFGFLLGTPYWILSFNKFVNGFFTIWSQSRYAYNFESGSPYLWELLQIMQSELVLGVLFLFAVIWAFLNFQKLFLPLLVVIMPTFLLVGSWSKKGLDYILIIFPAMILFIAIWYADVLKRHKKPWVDKLVVVIVIISLTNICFSNFKYSFPDTRKQASQWLINQPVNDTRICYAHYHYDIDLIDVERYLSYGEGSKFLAAEIKQKLECLRTAPQNTGFISFQKKISLSELSKAERMVIGEDPFLEQAFLNPHRSLTELKNLGVKYLILNSDTYLKFLNNAPPGTDNPLRGDFIIRRDFYKNILKKFSPAVIFKPDFLHCGPTIQIFDLEVAEK